MTGPQQTAGDRLACRILMAMPLVRLGTISDTHAHDTWRIELARPIRTLPAIRVLTFLPVAEMAQPMSATTLPTSRKFRRPKMSPRRPVTGEAAVVATRLALTIQI